MLMRATRSGLADKARCLIVLTMLCGAIAVAAEAQNGTPASREELLATQEAERARGLTPPTFEPGERIVNLFAGPVTSGFTPSFGGLISGGGFNAGVAYTRFFADTSSWAVRGVYSVRQFSLVEGSLRLPDLADGRLLLAARVATLDGPRVEFFGLGNESREGDRVFYGQRRVDAGLTAVFRPTRLIVLGGGIEYLRREAGENRGSGRSLEERFTPANAPGFGETTNFGHYFGSAALDWRPAAGYAPRGGLSQVSLHAYRSGGADAVGGDDGFSFERLDVDLVQHLPILRANWIISLRGRLSTTMGGDDQAVPFYLLPRLGGSDGVRGYGAYRFLDRHSYLVSAEYRWTPGEALDMAVFWDAGRVAATRDDLSLRGIKSSVGIGVRFHSPSLTALRIELAVSREGPHIVFAFSPSF